MREATSLLTQIIKNLRSFLDTEQTTYIEKAYEINKTIKERDVFDVISGYEDLDNNLKSMYTALKQNDGDLQPMFIGNLTNQAVYTIVRANIANVGLGFKIKRMRKIA